MRFVGRPASSGPFLLGTFALCVLAACVGPRGFTHRMRPPPPLSLGRPTRVWVAAPSRSFGAPLADRVARGIGRRGIDALAVPAERLEDLRREGILGPGQVVLRFRWRTQRQEVSSVWDEGAFHCEGIHCTGPLRWRRGNPTRVEVTLRVRAYDAPSATLLGGVRLRRELVLEDEAEEDAVLAHAMAGAILHILFPEAVRHEVVWVPVGSSRARAVLSALRRGRFRQARLRAARLKASLGREALLEASAWLHDETVPWGQRREAVRRAVERAVRGAAGDRRVLEAVEAIERDLVLHERWARRKRRGARLRAFHERLWATRVPAPPPAYSERRPGTL